MPWIDTAADVAAGTVNRCIVEPEIDVYCRHRRHCGRSRIVVIQIVVIVATACSDVDKQCESNIGIGEITVQYMSRQLLPGNTVVIGHVQVAAICLHIAGGNQRLRIEGRNSGCVSNITLVRDVSAGRNIDFEAIIIIGVPPQRCGSSSIFRREQSCDNN